jgi:hypothetical protein
MMNGKLFFSNDLSCNHQYIRRSYALQITNVSMKWELMNEIGCCTLSFTEYPCRCTLCSSHSLADAFSKVLRLKRPLKYLFVTLQKLQCSEIS